MNFLKIAVGPVSAEGAMPWLIPEVEDAPVHRKRAYGYTIFSQSFGGFRFEPYPLGTYSLYSASITFW